jgi:hypothetical protein
MGDPIATALHRQAEAARGLMASLADYDDETRHDTLEGETSLLEAIDAALAEIDECAAIEAGCASVIETYTKRAQKAKARAERVRGLIEQAMLIAEVPTAKRPSATITVKTVPPKAMITDESAIPSAYWKPQAPALDRTAINAAFKEGKAIPGVSADNGGTSLQIRRL